MTDVDPRIEKTLATAYDPLQDPASDGFVDLEKKAWKDGASGLDAANAAPLAPESTRNRLKYWLWVLALLVAFGVGWTGYSKYQAHKVAVKAIQTAPVVLIEPPKVDPVPDVRKKVAPTKTATQKIATQSINTPAMPVLKCPLTTEKPVKIAEPLTQFDRDLLDFERKIP